MEKYFRIGVFSNTHGIKGEIKVFPTTDNIKRFDDLKSVILDTNNGQINFDVEGVRYFKNMAILKFKDINRIEDIEMYKGCDILVTRENAVPLENNEYYIADLIGLKVFDEEQKKLGIISNVIQTGANDVYVVKTDKESDLLIPSIKECIKEINIKEGYVKVHLLDGLLDL